MLTHTCVLSLSRVITQTFKKTLLTILVLVTLQCDWNVWESSKDFNGDWIWLLNTDECYLAMIIVWLVTEKIFTHFICNAITSSITLSAVIIYSLNYFSATLHKIGNCIVSCYVYLFVNVRVYLHIVLSIYLDRIILSIDFPCKVSILSKLKFPGFFHDNGGLRAM